MPVPEGFDYEMWLGPAPSAPYHKDRCLYRFRFILDYSGGQTTNFGCPLQRHGPMGHRHRRHRPGRVRGPRAPSGPCRAACSPRPRRSPSAPATPTASSCSAGHRSAASASASKAPKAGSSSAYPRRAEDFDPASLLNTRDRPRRNPPARQQSRTARRTSPKLLRPRPRAELPRLREVAQGSDRAGGSRPPHGQHLPPGQHRHAAAPQDPLGPRKQSRSSATTRPAAMLSRPMRAPWTM